jgi:hypothetical protein
VTASRRRGITALTAALALAVGGLVAVEASAAAPTEFVSAGTLTLRTGTTDAISFGEGTSAMSQALTTAGDCNLLNPAGSLLQFTGYLGDPGATDTTTPPVGFKNDSIGVNEEIDSLCFRVDTTSRTGKPEYLDVALSPSLVNFAGRPLLASSASLDIEVKQAGLLNRTKAKVEATALRDGSPVGTFTLVQGSATSTESTFYCNVGDQGNCRWTITPDGYFDTLRLKAASAGFSLEGGSETGTSATTFDLVSEVDTVLDCDEPTLTQGDATVTYLGNADGSDCGAFGVTLTAGDGELRFLKPLDIDPTAQFIFDVTWKQASEGPAAAVPTVSIDFENPTGVRDDDLQFCPEILYFEGDLVGVQDPDDIGLLPDWRPEDEAFPLDGTQYACLADPRSVDIGAGEVTITDRIFLIGDAKMILK